MGLFDRVRNFFSSKFGTSTRNDRRYSTPTYERSRSTYERSSTRLATSSTTRPTTLSTTRPATLSTTRPATLSTTRPGTLSTRPATPSITRPITRPTTSSTTRPATSSTTRPATSSTTRPATSSTTRPATSSTTRPATSSTTRPATSSTTRPATSSATRPATSSTTRPATSSTTRPATSSATRPATSSTTRPATSSTTRPATSSATIRPATSPTTRPATSSTTRPATSSATRPATSLTTRPATSPSTTRPATSSTTRPATSSTNCRLLNSSSSLNTVGTPSSHQVKDVVTGVGGRLNECELPAAYSFNYPNSEHGDEISNSMFFTTASTATATKRPLTDKTSLKTSHNYIPNASSMPWLTWQAEAEKIGLMLPKPSACYPSHVPVVPSTPVPHSLKDVTFKLESLPKDRSFTPQSNTVYHNQWTTCNAIVVDEFTNQVNTAGEVEITSQSPIEFRNAKLVNGRLQFSMKASDAGNCATINFTINKHFVITKDVYVDYNPPSSVLSEITIRLSNESHHSREDKFTLRVSIIDVFGDPALRNSAETNCALSAIVLESEDHDSEEEIEKSICSDYHLQFDLSGRRIGLWSKKVQVFLNGKEIDPDQKFKVPDGEEKDAFLKWRSEALEDDDYESIPDFLVFDSQSRVIIPVPTDLDERKFVPYDDERCQIQALPRGGHKLVCKHAAKHVILGADCAHINNIKRVLEVNKHLEIKGNPTQTSIIFDQGNVTLNDLRTCKDAVRHLLRGSYYRDKASKAARARMEWKGRVEELDEILKTFGVKTTATVRFCKFFKDCFGDLMNKYNREACEELFSFFNFNRDECEVDLHGLYVADEERLKLLRLTLLSKDLSDKMIEDTIRDCRLKPKSKSTKKDLMAGRLSEQEVDEFIESGEVYRSDEKLEALRDDLLRRCKRSEEVDKIIEIWRAESDEAIRKLKETLEKFDLEEAVENNSPWIEIIVGAGHHSRKKEKQNIRPKVEKFLKERGNKFTPVNRGSLVVTFIEYSGAEPCFGEYYCVQCDRCWKSSKSYTGKYQKCSRCLVKCWPVKQREKERTVNYRREGREERGKSKPHQSNLCQRCQELGYPCNEEDL